MTVERPQTVLFTPARNTCTTIRMSSWYRGNRRLEREDRFGAGAVIFRLSLFLCLAGARSVTVQGVSRFERVFPANLNYGHATSNGIYAHQTDSPGDRLHLSNYILF